MLDKILITVAADICRKHDCRQVIILAWDGKKELVVTWGTTAKDAVQAAAGGNEIKRVIGWPEALCHAFPGPVDTLKSIQ